MRPALLRRRKTVWRSRSRPERNSIRAHTLTTKPHGPLLNRCSLVTINAWERQPAPLRAMANSETPQVHRDQLSLGTQNRKAARQSPAARTHSFSHRRPRTYQATTGGGRLALGYKESGEQSQAARRHFYRRNHPRALLLLLRRNPR